MRNHLLIICTGAQGVGKSYRTLKEILHSCYVSQYKKSALIFDTNGNEYAEIEIDGKTHRIKPIGHSIKDIINFSNNPKKEVRRISTMRENGSLLSTEESELLLLNTVTYLRNSTLLLEDTNRIFGDALPQSIAGHLVNVRHRQVDTILHLQSAGRILPKFMQNASIVRYHYQYDSIIDSRDKLGGDYEIFSIVEKLVNSRYESGDKYFVAYIYRNEKKVKGMFSPKMFTEAIQEYLSENPKSLNALLIKRNQSGQKVFNYESGLKQRTVELFQKYYGN